jgi:Glycosyl hydrolase catalytic core
MVRARRRSRRTSMIGFAVCKRLPLATAAGFSITRFGMSPTMLVELTQLAQQTLKLADPRIRIIGPSPYSVGYLQQFLAAGGGRYMDIVGYHIYNAPPEDDARILADLRMVKENAGLADKPLWITEGATGDTTTKPSLAPGLLARKYLVELLYGARRFFWYAWGPANSFCLGTTIADGFTPSKAGVALGYLEDWLIGATLLDTSIDSAGNWVVQLQTPTAAPAYIVWNPTRLKTWTVPARFQPTEKRDLLGGIVPVSGQTSFTVAPQPLLIVGQ